MQGHQWLNNNIKSKFGDELKYGERPYVKCGLTGKKGETEGRTESEGRRKEENERRKEKDKDLQKKLLY